MRDRVPDLSAARVLISNDDGVEAPGIKALERAMVRIAGEVWTCAPETEQSAASHALTLREPLRIKQKSEKRFSVTGTPTDSVLLGIQDVMKDAKPDFVVSGINRGANLGEDVIYSGTVAAAMEGALMGYPAFAFSLTAMDGIGAKWEDHIHWDTAEHFVGEVLSHFAGLEMASNALINVNIPNLSVDQVKGIKLARQGKRKIGCDLHEGFDPRGERYLWVGHQRDEDRQAPGTDLEAMMQGFVTVTPLSLDLTHDAMMGALKGVFS